MKKLFFTACLGIMTVGMQAQETYEVAELATEDLNGTARYVGMGGAMEALGADISTMGTNPAGVGLFRRSWIDFAMWRRRRKVGWFLKRQWSGISPSASS